MTTSQANSQWFDEFTVGSSVGVDGTAGDEFPLDIMLAALGNCPTAYRRQDRHPDGPRALIDARHAASADSFSLFCPFHRVHPPKLLHLNRYRGRPGSCKPATDPAVPLLSPAIRSPPWRWLVGSGFG